MSDIGQGNHAYLYLSVGDVYRVTTGGKATVSVLWGAPAGDTVLTASTQDFGPFSAPAKLRVTADIGTAGYWIRPQGSMMDLSAVAWSGVYGDLSGRPALGTGSGLDCASSGNAASGQLVKGSDSRLTDARTPTAHSHTANGISDSTAVGRAVIVAVDQAAARAAIGAGTSSFSGAWSALSGTPATFPPSSHTHPMSDISDSTATGRALLGAADAAAARTALGASSAEQRTRVQTDTAGAVTWTFATPFPVGVTPVIEVSVEDSSSATWNHQLVSVSRTAVSIRLTKTTSVTVVGISVLGIAANPQAYVHLTAGAP